jgi:hypothetical protein
MFSCPRCLQRTGTSTDLSRAPSQVLTGSCARLWRDGREAKGPDVPISLSLFPPTFVPDVPVPSRLCPGCSCSFPPLSRMFLFPPAFVPGGHNRSYSTFPCGLMFSVGLWVFHQQPLELSFLSVGLVLDLSQHDSIDLTHTLCQVPGHRGHKTNKTHCSCPGAG